MPKFLVVHPLPTPATIEELTLIGKMVKAYETVDACWICSWCQLDKEGKIVKILCQWNASNVDEVREVTTKIPVPTEGIYPMMILDSLDFKHYNNLKQTNVPLYY